MKIKFLILVCALIFNIGVPCVKAETLDVLPLFSSQSKLENRLWVGTFQLAWNDLMDGIVKGPVKFSFKTPKLVKMLNKKTFTSDSLSENSYYKVYGETSPELKTEIETAIKEKFNETSDIIYGLDWSKGKGKYTVYAMLKKDFKFLTPFDKLNPAEFGNTKENVDYFGINPTSERVLRDMVRVLFYNSREDFAVVIATQSNDLLYLYRTNDDKTFDKLYSDMLNKQAEFLGDTEFTQQDEIMVPDITLYSEKSFDEVCRKHILGTDFMISQALETVDFKMNNEGVQLKSEAVIMTMLTALRPEVSKPRKFYYNDTFVLFLQEADKDLPYFALRVKDVSTINKTGR